MGILDALLSDGEWRAFLAYKEEKGHLSKAALRQLTENIESREYLPAAERISRGGFFSLPEAVKVNKAASGKKRTVFIFPEEEKLIQKFLAYKLLNYDYLFCDNLYSFRRNMGVKKAITRLVFYPDIANYYSYKLDISDYFNSVDASLLLPMLKAALSDDGLYTLFEAMLLEPYCLVNGEKQKIKKGILAGSPLSGFLANLYLNSLDRWFEERGILYARYSDDIIFFADTAERLQEYIDTVHTFLADYRLCVNENKVFYSQPQEEWTFLGFSYQNGVIDISAVSKMKLKKKMRRKARALYRWRLRKNAEPERAAAAFIRYFNRKLYENPVHNEITWARWYFPVINTADSLKELDSYMQQCIRFIATGKQNKAQYNFSYEQMRSLGYGTLVNRYFKNK